MIKKSDEYGIWERNEVGLEYKPFESCVQPYKVVLYRFIYEDGKWEFYPSSGWMFTGKEVKKILKMANDLEKGKFDFGRDKEKFESIKKLSKYLDCEKGVIE